MTADETLGEPEGHFIASQTATAEHPALQGCSVKPDIGTFLEIRPIAARAVPRLELEAQGFGIVVDHELQRVAWSEMFEQLKNDHVTDDAD